MRNVLAMGVLITSLGMVIFFPLNINEKYTCFFHRIFDHAHPVSSVDNLENRHVHQKENVVLEKSNSTIKDVKNKDGSEREMISASHGSPLLDNYISQYAFAWWASVGLFALTILRWLKFNKKSKNIVIRYFFYLTLALPSIGYTQVDENDMRLDQLILMAIDRNPQLHSFYNATLADSSRISQSGALPDPILSFNLLNLPTNSFSFDQEPMTGKQVALRQQFPFPGKLSLKEKISSENTIVSVANYHEYKNQLIKELKQAYYDLSFIDKSIEITIKNQRLLEKFAKIAETKYSVGKGIQQDVLKAQVEYSKMTDNLIQLEHKRNVKRAQINTLINAPADFQVGEAVEPVFQPINKDLDTLKIIAASSRPLLRGWESMKKQSILKVDLAKKEYWPDIGLFIAYTQRDELQNGNPGYDFLSGGISINIPIYSGNKQSQKVEESQYTRNMIDDRYTQVLNHLYYEIENTRSSMDKNARLIHLFKTDILPQASQSVESALVGYQTEKVDFLTLVSNQITLFNYDLDYFRVLSDYNKDIASLEFLTGKPFDTNKN